jgi:FAD-dependent sensor of blue light
VVTALTRSIAADPRHAGVRILAESKRGQREYADWTMGYLHHLNLEDELETLLMIRDRLPLVIGDVLERMRPDPVMGARR